MLTVKSSDVLDVTHHTSHAFRAQVIGAFRRMGPNAWDDYRYVAESGPELDVFPAVGVQLEPSGAEIRSRHGGCVVRMRWTPNAADLAALRSDRETGDSETGDSETGDSETGDSETGATPQALRRWFVSHYLIEQASETMLGASAVVAAKLSSD